MALLSLTGVTVLSLGAVLQASFDQDPLQNSPLGSNDALNPLNWTLAGPGSVRVTGGSILSGSPNSVLLFLNVPLAVGAWTITVKNVQTASGDLLGVST